jgi:DNA anti-recombination protein RmuC
LLLGSLVGLLAGPVGVGVGAIVGSSAGAIGDLNIADVNLDFVQEVADALTPGLFALIVDANEEWVTPVDTRMETLGGVVFRTERQHFEAEQRAKEVAALKTEIADLKAEHAGAKADRKAKLQARIDSANTKLQQKLQKAKQRSEQIKNESDAKVQALKGQAAKARGDAKANIETSIAKMREKYDQSTARLKTLAA